MQYSNITLGLCNLTEKSINELYNDLENYKLLETDTKLFLLNFFRKDILESLFIRQICTFSPKAIYDFQENIFINVRQYLNSMFNIEGLTFSYNKNEFPLKIEISLSEMLLCTLDIYNKRIEILEEYYFKDITNGLNKLELEKNNLLEEYSKYSRYASNNMELLKDSSDKSITKNLDIMLSSMKKKNKYKAENLQKCLEIENRINEINLEMQEYYLIESVLRKNMMSINYYQNKISERISRNLHYEVVKN